jgi:TonB family protein
MPLNVRRFYTSLLLILCGILTYGVYAQTVPPQTNTATAQPSPQPPPVRTPTAGEIMRERISKAKAFIAVRNYNAANYELESIKRETGDPAVQSVVNVLLMNSYLEQGDYKRAQDFLNQAYNIQKTTAPNAAANYFTVASQIVKGARSRVERYRALGLNPSDRTLPLEAVNDLEKMRETLEMVVTEVKEISKDKTKSADAMALLEEATTSRSMIARDDYDARKWRDEVADAREELASSRSVVLNAINEAPSSSTPSPNTTAMSTPQSNPVITDTSFKPPATLENKPAEKTLAINNPPPATLPASEGPKTSDAPQYVPMKEPERGRVVDTKPVTQKVAETTAANPPEVKETAKKDAGPLDVGSLLAYAIKQSQPIYPAAARSMRSTGVVRVEVLIDEDGSVAEVQGASGPMLLQGAAKDAIRKWRFRPFVKDGQPVRAVGYVSFNFAL